MVRTTIRPLLISRPIGIVAGAERHFEHLARGLTALGVSTHVVVIGAGCLDNVRFVDRLEEAGASARLIPNRRSVAKLYEISREVRAGVMHWNFPSPSAFNGAAWLLVPWGLPMVATEHLPMLAPPQGRWAVTRRLANYCLDAIVVSSEDSAKALEAQWRHAPNVFVVPNATAPVASSTRVWAKGRPLQILSVGRLAHQKNPGMLIDVLVHLQRTGTSASLRFVGTGPLEEDLRSRTRALGLDSTVEFSGWAEDVDAELRNADLFMSAARFEGMPFAVLEALATGLPVLASDIGPHREIARRGDGIRLAPTDCPEAWSTMIGEMVGALPALSSQASKTATNFSPAALAAGVLSVYEGRKQARRRASA